LDLGKRGEGIACRYLQGKGYRIITTNYRNRVGELDIIAQEGDCLVFIEVKTRSGEGPLPPQASVTLRKQAQLIKTAICYLKEKGLYGSQSCRFDVVAITYKKGGSIDIELIRDAFILRDDRYY